MRTFTVAVPKLTGVGTVEIEVVADRWRVVDGGMLVFCIGPVEGKDIFDREKWTDAFPPGYWLRVQQKKEAEHEG